jgi:hypothetical protein
MDVLSHSQISVTMNTYSHVPPSLVDAAPARLIGRSPTPMTMATTRTRAERGPAGSQGSGWGSGYRCCEHGTQGVGLARVRTHNIFGGPGGLQQTRLGYATLTLHVPRRTSRSARSSSSSVHVLRRHVQAGYVYGVDKVCCK